ncbi:hypothetical protein U9M48_025034, partial [Paspalum notatum var. saurae]
HCIHRTHFAYDGVHIDHGIEEQTPEQPLIEEPEDQEPDPQPEEYPQAAPDFASEEANPSEEGVDWNLIALDSLAALALAPTLGDTIYTEMPYYVENKLETGRRLSLLFAVWSSSSVLVSEEGPVITRSKKRHELALE